MNGVLKGGRKADLDRYTISDVWYLGDRAWAFQKVGKYYELYDHNGNFCREFTSFHEMTKFIHE